VEAGGRYGAVSAVSLLKVDMTGVLFDSGGSLAG
jgi:hypothetical protein